MDSRKKSNRLLNPYFSAETPYVYDQSSCVFHYQEQLGSRRRCFHATIERGNLSYRLESTNGSLCTTFDCFKTCANISDEMLDNVRWPFCKSPCSEYLVQYGANTMSLLLENVVEESLLGRSMQIDEMEQFFQNPFTKIGTELKNRTIAILQLAPENNIVEDIIEENKYSVADFLGILGGNISLWVGVSVISLAEFLELLYIWITLRCHRSKTRSNSKQVPVFVVSQMSVINDRDKYLYHYTNPRGSNGILNDKIIRVTEAGSRFAWYGRGVYMTALSPTVGRKKLLYNNHRKYDTRDPNLWAKTSIYFKVRRDYLPGAEKQSTSDGRDVWVYRNDIYIDMIRYKTGLSDDYLKSQSNSLITPQGALDYEYEDSVYTESQLRSTSIILDPKPTYQSIHVDKPIQHSTRYYSTDYSIDISERTPPKSETSWWRCNIF
ncbi:hypothetical protein CHUAL_002239 [Chamberlinius hualienensis]